MSELKNGDMVMCGTSSTSLIYGPFFYIGPDDRGRHVVKNGCRAEIWKLATKVKEKEFVPFTKETFPKGLVFIKHKGIGSELIITGVTPTGVMVGGVERRFVFVFDDYLISTDGRETWQVAGTEKGGE